MAIPYETDGILGTQTLLVPSLKEGGYNWETSLFHLTPDQLRQAGFRAIDTPVGYFLIRKRDIDPRLTPVLFEGNLKKSEAYIHSQEFCKVCIHPQPALVSLNQEIIYSCANCATSINRSGRLVSEKHKGPFVVNKRSNLTKEQPLERYPNIFESLSDLLKQIGVLSATSTLLPMITAAIYSHVHPEVLINYNYKNTFIWEALALLGTLSLPASQVIDRFQAFGPIKNPDNIILLSN